VEAGVISRVEKRLYRCDDSPDEGEQLVDELEFELANELFK